MNTIFEEINKTFGLELKSPKPKGSIESVEIEHEDGAQEVAASAPGGFIGLSSDLWSVPTDEVELINTYRSLSLTSDVDRVLNEIRNEVFVFDKFGEKAIDIDFNEDDEDKIPISKSVMSKIKVEYNAIYNLLDFNNKGLDLFNRWYIDGRLFLHKIVDKNKLKEGIKKVVLIDPLKIKKVVEYPQPNKDGVYDLNLLKTYYIFSEVVNVFSTTKSSRFVKINKDAIAYSDSGIYDIKTGAPLSNLWKMIIPYNNLRMMEEALLVYRVVRSPERRAFYVNVGSLSKPKAEQYMKELMAKFKNKLIYDSKTGTIVDRKNVMSMVEDYWLPRRDDGRGTEIQTLPGATNLGTVDDVEVFRKKFLESSNIPANRFKDDAMSFIFGRSTEISRDEYRFRKFLDRIRRRFITVIEDLLKTQLILKNIIVESDWEDIKKYLYWIFVEDNSFVQWKEAEVLNSRLESLNAADPFVGKYFDRMWVMKNVLRMGDNEAQQLLDEADKEKELMAPEVPPNETNVTIKNVTQSTPQNPEEPTPDEEPN